jgi:hypothetical protein
MHGEEIEALVKNATAAPPEILARLRELYGAGRD